MWPRAQNAQCAVARMVPYRRKNTQHNRLPRQRAARVDFRHEDELIERHRGP